MQEYYQFQIHFVLWVGEDKLIAQLNCFTFGYLFVELVVGSPVGMRNFL